MVLLTLVDGKKGPRDTLVLVTAYNEPLSFAEWLFIGKCYLDSEASYYPIQKGFLGETMLVHALDEISRGIPFDKVLERYKLKRKDKGLKIIDKRKARAFDKKVIHQDACMHSQKNMIYSTNRENSEDKKKQYGRLNPK